MPTPHLSPSGLPRGLTLPSGRDIDRISRDDLFDELAAMRVPGIDESQGKHDLARCLAAYVAERKALADDLPPRTEWQTPEQQQREFIRGGEAARGRR